MNETVAPLLKKLSILVGELEQACLGGDVTTADECRLIGEMVFVLSNSWIEQDRIHCELDMATASHPVQQPG